MVEKPLTVWRHSNSLLWASRPCTGLIRSPRHQNKGVPRTPLTVGAPASARYHGATYCTSASRTTSSRKYRLSSAAVRRSTRRPQGPRKGHPRSRSCLTGSASRLARIQPACRCRCQAGRSRAAPSRRGTSGGCRDIGKVALAPFDQGVTDSSRHLRHSIAMRIGFGSQSVGATKLHRHLAYASIVGITRRMNSSNSGTVNAMSP